MRRHGPPCWRLEWSTGWKRATRVWTRLSSLAATPCAALSWGRPPPRGRQALRLPPTQLKQRPPRPEDNSPHPMAAPRRETTSTHDRPASLLEHRSPRLPQSAAGCLAGSSTPPARVARLRPCAHQSPRSACLPGKQCSIKASRHQNHRQKSEETSQPGKQHLSGNRKVILRALRHRPYQRQVRIHLLERLARRRQNGQWIAVNAHLHVHSPGHRDLRVHIPGHGNGLFIDAAIFVVLHYPDHGHLVSSVLGPNGVPQRVLIGIEALRKLLIDDAGVR